MLKRILDYYETELHMLNWNMFKNTWILYGPWALIIYAFMPLRPRWVVNNDGELGFKLGPFEWWYYKWPDPNVTAGNYRVMEKREFGEVIKSKL